MSNKPLSVGFDNLEVLLIDSNKHMRLIARSILISFGCKSVREHGDATSALAEIQHSNTDLVIVSWLLEPINGLELVKLLRTGSDSPNVYVPIIMMSGRCEYQHVIAARDAGANEFLAKPISPHTLYQRIVSLIENPRRFVRSNAFFGPCRRRKELGPPPGILERRKAEEADEQDTGAGDDNEPIGASAGTN
jgi:DNA-binding response OmpR family regulator